MKILVIGGTGIIGTAIIEGALRAGFEVYSVARKHPDCSNIHIHTISEDWTDNNTAAKIFYENKFDVVIDGLLMKLEQAKRDLELASGHCRHFIYISSDGVYNRPANNIKEEVPINMKDIHWDIMYNKRKIELYINNMREQYPFMITTIRPSLTYGKTRVPCAVLSRKNQWTLVERIIKEKPIVFIDDKNSLHSITPSVIFGDAVAGIFLNKNADGETYHISNGNAYTWDEIINSIGDLIGHSPQIVHIPIKWIRKYNSQLYIEILNDKLDTLTLDISKLRTISPNVNYDIELGESLKDTIEYLKKYKADEPSDDQFNMMCDDILINYSKVGINPEEKLLAQNYIESLTINEINEIKTAAKKMIIENKIIYVCYKCRKIALKYLPLCVVRVIKKIKKYMFFR